MEEKKKNPFKYATIIIVMFVVGLVVGLIFSNISKNKTSSSEEQESIISEEKAKEIALEDAKKDFKIDAELDTELYIKRDREDGEDVYEIEFVIEGIEYEYKIKVSDGTIVDKDTEIIMNNSTTTLTLEDATSIALEDSNLKENEVNLLKTKMEVEDGTSIYEIEFSDTDKTYDYEIDVTTGEIVKKEVELKNKNLSGSSNITEEEAKEIAISHSGLNAATVVIKKIELEEKSTVYEIEFYQGNKEYEYEIHIPSGTILKYSWKVR